MQIHLGFFFFRKIIIADKNNLKIKLFLCSEKMENKLDWKNRQGNKVISQNSWKKCSLNKSFWNLKIRKIIFWN